MIPPITPCPCFREFSSQWRWVGNRSHVKDVTPGLPARSRSQLGGTGGGGLCPVSARPWWGGGESHGSGQLAELPLEPSSPCHTRVAPLNSVTSAVGPGEWGEGKGTGSRQCASASPLLSQAPVILLSFQQLLETGAATCSEELAEVWRAWSAGEKRCRGWFGGLGARVLPISSLPRQRCFKRTVRLLAGVLNLAVQE